MRLELIISQNDGGQRADRYLRRYLAALSLARIQSLFRRKEIKVARKPIGRNHVLQAGDTLEVFGLKEEEILRVENPGIQPPILSGSQPPFPILFEDPDLLVVDKPAGIAVHPGTDIPPGRSLIELAHAYLAAHSPPQSQSSQNEIFQPALVHRLDRETSGVLVIAKSGAALRSLTAALRAGQLHKAYLALIHGHPPEKSGTLRDSLARIDSRTGGAKAIVDEEEGRESISHYTVVETLGKFTLVRVIIETGRMHQIRAHFTHAGLPLAGDRRYGNPDSAKTMREQFGLKRIFLHAESLELTDLSGKGRKFKAPLPPALEAVLTQVRQHQSEKKTD